MKDFVIGDTDKKKFESINRTLQAFSRRLGKRIIGVIPPSHLFADIADVGEDGVIFKRLFAINGVIAKVAMLIEEIEGKTLLEFELSAVGVGAVQAKKFKTIKKLNVLNLDLPIDAGDLVTLRVSEPERVKGIYIGAAFDIALRDLRKENFLIEEFEQLMEGKDAESTTWQT